MQKMHIAFSDKPVAFLLIRYDFIYRVQNKLREKKVKESCYSKRFL